MLGTPDLPHSPNAGDTQARRVTIVRSHKPIFWLAIAVALLLAAGGGLLLSDVGRRTHTPPPSALGILEGVRAEVIPAENSPSGYGPAFNYAGYETLLEWNREDRVNAALAADFESLNVSLQCCDFAAPSADESKNCGCGHHQALYGLSKRLLLESYSRAETQAEIGRWAAYMYPKETLQAEMERRAFTDPAVNRALQELKAKGEC